MGRLHQHWLIGSVLLLALPAYGASRTKQNATSTAPSGTPQAEFRLQIFDLLAAPDALKEINADELGRIKQPKELEQRLGSTGALVQYADFRVTCCTAGPMRLSNATRLPTFAPAPGKSVTVSYAEVGTSVEITSQKNLSQSGDETILPLKIIVSAPPRAGELKPETTVYEKEVRVLPGRSNVVMLDDSPQPAGEGQVRLRIANVLLSIPTSSQPAGEVSKTGTTKADLHCFQLIYANQDSDKADIETIVRDRPSAAQLLERLKKFGSATECAAETITFDVSAGLKTTQGERLPVVQDVTVAKNGAATPAITYEEVGTILQMGPSEWRLLEDSWTATCVLKLEASGIGESGVTVAPNVTLPTFIHRRINQTNSFRSGIPEYLIFRSLPTGDKPDSKITVWIARVMLTRQGA